MREWFGGLHGEVELISIFRLRRAKTNTATPAPISAAVETSTFATASALFGSSLDGITDSTIVTEVGLALMPPVAEAIAAPLVWCRHCHPPFPFPGTVMPLPARVSLIVGIYVLTYVSDLQAIANHEDL